MPRHSPAVAALLQIATRLRVLFARLAARLGMGEGSFLIPLAVVVGVVTAVAAVAFHELILLIRHWTYGRLDPGFLYGPGAALLVVIPAAGGLAVGLISRKLAGEREGHGVVDVIESVARTRGFVRPGTAAEKILTSALTIGTGGSAGAEGPIVQIGAALSGGVGALFRIARHQMPTLVGCGCAAGISAIFNAPIGGLLFTLEVILLDFSIRTITPIIIASVVANVTMRALVPAVGGWLHGGGESAYITVFAAPHPYFGGEAAILSWGEMGNFVLLGLACGGVGLALMRGMQGGERFFRRALGGSTTARVLRPAAGGALLGLLGLAAAAVATTWMRGEGTRVMPFENYPHPAFYGDGYPVIEHLLGAALYVRYEPGVLVAMLLGLCAAKLLATVFTLASGGSGGVIAPSLFLGAAAGGGLGVLLRETGWFTEVRPEAYALVGMAAVLAAVVHAPLASILILFEITGEEKVLLPAMLGVIVAVGVSRLIARDSLYTAALRHRGIRWAGGPGAASDPALLSRLSVEQVGLEPATILGADEPLSAVLDLLERAGPRSFPVVGREGRYVGLLTAEEVQSALAGREAAGLLIVGDVMRVDVPLVLNTDDLAGVLELLARHDLTHLPVGLAGEAPKVIGLISRAAIVRRAEAAGR